MGTWKRNLRCWELAEVGTGGAGRGGGTASLGTGSRGQRAGSFAAPCPVPAASCPSHRPRGGTRVLLGLIPGQPHQRGGGANRGCR